MPFDHMNCQVCAQSRGDIVHTAREMMFGLRTVFHYAECKSCGSLELTDPPNEWSLYYPSSYYSYSPLNVETFKYRLKNRLCLTPLGKLLAKYRTELRTKPLFLVGLRPKWRILDVGCGRGELLYHLKSAGCKHVTGVDPYLTATVPEDLDVRACSLSEVSGRWDLIMFHHSFEHMVDARNVLTTVKNLLAPSGWCIIRIPVIGWAWERFGVNWVQLDAPRHRFIYSVNGFKTLASMAGLKVLRVDHDSFELQFFSQLYERDIPLCDLSKHPFSNQELAGFRNCSRNLNRQGHGDQAVFYLQQRAEGD
jgi:SAM-dependent methyltransferase